MYINDCKVVTTFPIGIFALHTIFARNWVNLAKNNYISLDKKISVQKKKDEKMPKILGLHHKNQEMSPKTRDNYARNK